MEDSASDLGDMRICTACLGDRSYKERIEQNGKESQCDFDERHGGDNKTLTVIELAEIVDDDFRSRYDLGGEVPHVSDNSDKVYYTQEGSPYKEIMQESLECSDVVIDAISKHLPDASPREVQKGADIFYDDTSNYSLIDDDDNDPYADDVDEAPSVEPQRSPEEIHAELQSRIAELRKEILVLQSAPAGMGHNHPPEPIGSFEGIDKDLQDLDRALHTLQTQSVRPSDTALPEIEAARLQTVEIGSKWRDRLNKIGIAFTSGIAMEAGKATFHEMITEGWLSWAVGQLDTIASLAHKWISVVFHVI